MPPEAITAAGARKLNRPVTSYALATPRGASLKASTSPLTVTPSAPISRSVTLCRFRNRTRWDFSTAWANGSTSAGPVPHTRWNRGTELP